MSTGTDVVTIGRVLRPFGVHGDVHVESLSDVPDRFERLPSVTLLMPTGKSIDTVVIRARKLNRFYMVRFSAFSSPEEATKFRGALVQVQQESVPPLPDTQYYQFELIGLEVHDETGRILGTIEEVVTRPHQHLFVVRHEGHELLIPAVHPIIRHVDVPAGTITVAPFEQWGIPHAM
jgi:16S rRNA processing protein RimM